jgi:hypothetical protein
VGKNSLLKTWRCNAKGLTYLRPEGLWLKVRWKLLLALLWVERLVLGRLQSLGKNKSVLTSFVLL